MKENILKSIVLLLILTLLVSCGKKEESSSDESSKISVDASSKEESKRMESSIDKIIENSKEESSESKYDSQKEDQNSSYLDNSSQNSLEDSESSSSSHNSSQNNNQGSEDSSQEESKPFYPWEEPGAKQPSDYTWDEFEALDAGQQIIFQKSFGSFDAFKEWLEKVNPSEESSKNVYPWKEPGAKQPVDYTWAEFEALDANQQMAFQSSFVSFEAFEEWMKKVNPSEESSKPIYPWEEPGAKKPVDYTWAEFEALDTDQQMAFQSSFASSEAFEEWVKKVNPSEESSKPIYPWEKPGAKQPINYTWEEFEALDADQQMAFQKSFASADAFVAWMERVNSPEESSKPVYPWEKPGAKQPIDYTWEEFEALDADQQMAFQKSFTSADAFVAWMEKVNSTEESSPHKYPWEEPGAKQPIDYTWDEFEALEANQQIAFQKSFVSFDEFDAWLQKVQNSEESSTESNPWDAPGAKQPADYTWDEFEALPPGQQIAFQFAFEEEDGFEKWLTENMPE